MSDYGGGLIAGIAINGIPLGLIHPGKVFWVSNNSDATGTGIQQGLDTAATPGSYTRPFATLDYAIGRCTASRGDVIVIKPGHAETFTTAAAIVSDVAGVAVVGLGRGSDRPTFTAQIGAVGAEANATWSVTAANLSFYNLLFVADVDSATPLTTFFNVAAGGDNLTFDNCEMRDASSTSTFIAFITCATGVDNLTINNSKISNASTVGGAFLSLVAGDGLYISNSSLYQNGVSAAPTVGQITATGAVTNVLIKDSYFRSFADGAVLIDFQDAANSGLIANCYFSSDDAADATTTSVEFTGGHCFECYMAGDADSYAIAGGGAAIYNNA